MSKTEKQFHADPVRTSRMISANAGYLYGTHTNPKSFTRIIATQLIELLLCYKNGMSMYSKSLFLLYNFNYILCHQRL